MEYNMRNDVNRFKNNINVYTSSIPHFCANYHRLRDINV